MYKSIYVPVDNSKLSNQAINSAVALGKVFESKLTGSHVYAAKMHDYRFKQMEYTLPDEYRQEGELEKQRKVHDSLITMGLKLISDCYLDDMDKKCQNEGIPFERRMMDGKHFVEILKDLNNPEKDFDLVVLGALGIGQMKDSQIGAVCSRVTQESSKDVWVVKNSPEEKNANSDTILVCIDGSPQSFGAMTTAIEIAQKFNKKIELISVYDPYLHYMVFNGIVDVLNDKAARVFRFEEQNQLHEEVIDTGLAQIYQSHLDVAEDMIKKENVTISKKTLLDGKAFQKIVDYARKESPWLIVMGRIGVHSEKDENGLGSNTENLIRVSPCDVLLTTRLEYPEIDKKAEETILWTPEAKERMKKVPDLVRGIARTGILRLAVEEGHSVITNVVIDKAMDRFMPKQVADKTEKLGESLAFAAAKMGDVAMCKKCGVSANASDAVKCSVCGGTDFETVTKEMVEKIINSEGGAQDEKTYDGKSLSWTTDARNVLRLIKDMYQKRRAKALIEKHARIKKMQAVTREFVQNVLTNDLAIPLDQAATQALEKEFGNSILTADQAEDSIDQSKKLVARDVKGNPLFSVFEWDQDASARILKVPAGFMRDRVQTSVENLALDKKLLQINLSLVEEGIAAGRQQMEEMIMASTGQKPEKKPDPRVDQMNEVGVIQEMDKQRLRH
ncbi:hypothetical protein BVY03_02280 [bacterium K02(2017)]|nr:hypothetical protein BVY03_02280 [bacterium K02(2017)]